jgi:phosphotriesterase-related protein
LSVVETVRGQVPATGLGRTLMHEHLFILEPEALANFGHVWGASYWDEEARVGEAVEKLRAVEQAGFATFVDPTAIGLGRDVRRVARVNAQVGLNIVVATGVYAFVELPNFLRYRSTEQIAELFVRELREGIDDTGIKAGFLKCAIEEYGIVGDLPRIVEAIAIAAKETGAPIMVHTNGAARTGLLAIEAFARHDVDLTRLNVAHAGDSNDLGYLRELARSGAILGFDRFNIPHFNPDEDRIRTLLTLLEEGYAEQIVLSHDAAAFMDFFTGDPKFAGEQPDYLWISRHVLPRLLEEGVSQETIDTMLVEVPARFLGPRS